RPMISSTTLATAPNFSTDHGSMRRTVRRRRATSGGSSKDGRASLGAGRLHLPFSPRTGGPERPGAGGVARLTDGADHLAVVACRQIISGWRDRQELERGVLGRDPEVVGPHLAEAHVGDLGDHRLRGRLLRTQLEHVEDLELVLLVAVD